MVEEDSLVKVLDRLHRITGACLVRPRRGTFTNQQSGLDVGLTCIPDTAVEPDETIIYTISNPTFATIFATISDATGTKDDAP